MDIAAPSLGLTFVPWDHPPEDLPGFAATVEAAGVDTLWLWEDCFTIGGLTAAAVALTSTERIRVGIALLPAPLRNVALTAMEVATLARTFPGRLLPGVGHGVQSWMAQAGAKVASPMTLLDEYSSALRSLLAGEEVSVRGRYVRLDRVKLDHPPQPAPPLLMGGFGAKTLALSADRADGVLLARGGAEAVARMHRHLIATGRQAAIVLGIGGDGDDGTAAPTEQELIDELGRARRAGVTMLAVAPPPGTTDLAGFAERVLAADLAARTN